MFTKLGMKPLVNLLIITVRIFEAHGYISCKRLHVR